MLFLLLLAISFAFPTTIYTVDVDRSGFSSVTLSTDGGTQTLIALPTDAWNFRVVGGSFSIENDSALLIPGQSGFTTFSYSSRMLTTKSSSGWKLSFSPPADALALVMMPPYSVLESSDPQPRSVAAEDSRTLIELEHSGTVSLQYHLEESPEPTQTDQDGLLIIMAALAIIAAIAMIYRNMISKTTKPVQKPPSLDLTPGKKEMMETFNENDITVVNYLLSNNGKSRRNELERKSGISKSSLASSLNRLEKRKIIEMDRTATTHFVKLSDYFLKL